ncbi:uncharacterized protein LOC143074565 [Mytilus galloprovincialis]|uniref:uncharacterized protein LOC143074565 n=1 Tax=Mytilus galloprovincialis TaxID=29158 RepID=UPI003F7B414C
MKGFIIPLFAYAIFIEAVIAADPTQSPTLHFNCSTNGAITNISANGVPLGEFLVLGEDKFCKLDDSSCVKDKSELHVIHVKSIKDQQTLIIGGKDAHFYEMKCKPGGFLGKASVDINITNAGATYTPNEHTFSPINTAISLTIEKKEGSGPLKEPVKLGELLLLKFRGPDGYIVDPLKCTAYAGAVISSTSQELWSSDTCSSKNTAYLENMWKKDDSETNLISIKMYAFRFPNSNRVLIECSAHFCPELDSTCQTQCWHKNSTTIGRSRRDTFQNSNNKAHYMKRVSTFFTVVDDSVRSNRSSGASMNTFLYLLTIVIVTWYFT